MKSLWVPVSAATAQQKKVDTLANNIANINTPGFKRDEITFKEHLTALEKNIDDIHIRQNVFAPEDFYHSQGSQHSFVKVNGTYSEMDQGQLMPTKGTFDLALSGPGFFEVLTPTGIRYTRNGSFTVNKDGMITTRNGYPLLNALTKKDLESDVPKPPQERIITLPKELKSFSVGSNGTVAINGENSGEISVIEFKDPVTLKKIASGLFINKDPANIKPLEEKTSQVLQGFIEQSNVNAIKEMSELIKANRHFENIQRLIKTYDTISGKAVNEISKF